MKKRNVAGIGLLALLASGSIGALLNFEVNATGPSHGDNPNLGTDRGGDVGKPPKHKFDPKHVNVVYMRFEKGILKVDHAFFDSDGVDEVGSDINKLVDKKTAQDQIVYFKSNGKWENPVSVPVEIEGKLVKKSSFKNFEQYTFYRQARIFMFFENGDSVNNRWKFHKKWPILFTAYGTQNRKDKMIKNYSFYNTEILGSDTPKNLKDDFLYMENHFSHDHCWSWACPHRKLKYKDITRGDLKPEDLKMYNYSMNIHLIFNDGVNQKIPIIIDPDTGNGTDE